MWPGGFVRRVSSLTMLLEKSQGEGNPPVGAAGPPVVETCDELARDCHAPDLRRWQQQSRAPLTSPIPASPESRGSCGNTGVCVFVFHVTLPTGAGRLHCREGAVLKSVAAEEELGWHGG